MGRCAIPLFSLGISLPDLLPSLPDLSFSFTFAMPAIFCPLDL